MKNRFNSLSKIVIAKMSHFRISEFYRFIISGFIFLLVICGPGATWLQSQKQWASPAKQWDAIYLVCGAHAQNNRIKALSLWVHHVGGKQIAGEPHPLAPITPSTINHHPLILIGNDPQKGLWCRKHQTNHTVSEWAVEKISKIHTHALPATSSTYQSINNQLLIIPGNFSNTDGEMQALAIYLKKHPKIKSIALVTSRYHARRVQQRLHEHLETDTTIKIIPGIKHINNRNPIVVVLEYLKIIRDNMGLSHAPIISRPK